MSRIRTIKPEFFKHEGLFDAEVESGLPLRLAFAGLWTQCDKAGRFEWRPRQLKTDIMPYDDVDFSRVLDALATRGFVVRYASQDRIYGLVPSWSKHQIINNRERESELPAPDDAGTEAIEEQTENDASATRQPRVPHASVQLPSGRGKEREREKKSSEPIGSGADAPAGLSLEAEAYRLGKQVLGPSGGGLVTKLREHFAGDWASVTDLLRQAAEKGDPKAWVAGVLRGTEKGRPSPHVLFPDEAYRGVQNLG